MTGLELRKAALEAAGWTVHSRPVSDWNEHQQRYCSIAGYDTLYSVAFGEEPEFDGNRLSAWYGDALEAWRAAPAVESSVDEALKWLTLGDTHRWQFSEMDNKRPSDWMVAIQDLSADREEEKLTHIRWETSLPVAICRVYLQYKAGA